MSYTNPNNYAYGLVQGPLLNIFTPPQVALFNPGNNNKAQIGTLWINKQNNTVYALTSYLAGNPVWTALGAYGTGSGTDGQTLIAATGGVPIFANITPGAGIVIANGPNTITISTGAGPGFTWNADATVGPIAMVSSSGYVLANPGPVHMTLPAASVFGDRLIVIDNNAATVNANPLLGGGFYISQGAGQQILYGNRFSTPGAGGRLDARNFGLRSVVVDMICTVANLQWTVVNSNIGAVLI